MKRKNKRTTRTNAPPSARTSRESGSVHPPTRALHRRVQHVQPAHRAPTARPSAPPARCTGASSTRPSPHPRPPPRAHHRLVQQLAPALNHVFTTDIAGIETLRGRDRWVTAVLRRRAPTTPAPPLASNLFLSTFSSNPPFSVCDIDNDLKRTLEDLRAALPTVIAEEEDENVRNGTTPRRFTVAQLEGADEGDRTHLNGMYRATCAALRRFRREHCGLEPLPEVDVAPPAVVRPARKKLWPQRVPPSCAAPVEASSPRQTDNRNRSWTPSNSRSRRTDRRHPTTSSHFNNRLRITATTLRHNTPPKRWTAPHSKTSLTSFVFFGLNRRRLPAAVSTLGVFSRTQFHSIMHTPSSFH